MSLDSRVTNIDADFFSNLKFTGSLRDYQEVVLNICLSKTVGIIEAMTGSGKTITFIALVVAKKQNTLILMHTKELLYQTIKAFTKFTNVKSGDIGIIGDGKLIIKPITVGLHQSMHRQPDNLFKELSEYFGMIIADEVHIVAANTYYKTMTNLCSKYKFGFSATPKRNDGLTEVIHWATGPKIHIVPKEKLDNVLIKPSYKKIRTNYYFPLMSSREHSMLMNDLAQDTARNNLIFNTLKEYKGKYLCLLCVRLSQVHILHKMFGKKNAVILTSKMKKKDREESMDKILSGQVLVIISTYALFSTGIDIPKLEVLALCAPMSSDVILLQAAGRLMRMAEGKTTATVIDFIDDKIDLLKIQYYKRNRILKEILN